MKHSSNKLFKNNQYTYLSRDNSHKDKVKIEGEMNNNIGCKNLRLNKINKSMDGLIKTNENVDTSKATSKSIEIENFINKFDIDEFNKSINYVND